MTSLNKQNKELIVKNMDLQEQLLIQRISQQRELLLAWEEQKYFDFDWFKNKEMVTAKIDKYLANNCG